MWKAVGIWVGFVVVGALAGFLAGTVLWELGFELLGSTVAIFGAGFGGILALGAYLKWSEAI